MTTSELYLALAHKIQTGIAFLIPTEKSLTEPKHLQVGIEMRKDEHCAIVQLLMAKGIITKEEYAEAVNIELQKSVDELSARLEARYPGKKFTLH